MFPQMGVQRYLQLVSYYHVYTYCPCAADMSHILCHTGWDATGSRRRIAGFRWSLWLFAIHWWMQPRDILLFIIHHERSEYMSVRLRFKTYESMKNRTGWVFVVMNLWIWNPASCKIYIFSLTAKRLYYLIYPCRNGELLQNVFDVYNYIIGSSYDLFDMM